MDSRASIKAWPPLEPPGGHRRWAPTNVNSSGAIRRQSVVVRPGLETPRRSMSLREGVPIARDDGSERIAVAAVEAYGDAVQLCGAVTDVVRGKVFGVVERPRGGLAGRAEEGGADGHDGGHALGAELPGQAEGAVATHPIAVQADLLDLQTVVLKQGQEFRDHHGARVLTGAAGMPVGVATVGSGDGETEGRIVGQEVVEAYPGAEERGVVVEATVQGDQHRQRRARGRLGG